MTGFSECDPALDERPIRQGDVIRFLASDDPWERQGVIVTGDCDIARDKHSGRLTYIPILAARTYLSLFWFPRQLNRRAEHLGQQVVAQIRKFQRANLPDFPLEISVERGLSWTIERGPHELASILQVPEGRDLDSFVRLTKCYITVVAATNASFDDQYKALCEAKQVGQSDSTKIDRQMRDDLTNYLRSLPGDAMFLTSIGPQDDTGYVCYLRVLRDISDQEIAIRPRDVQRGLTAMRIARLRSPYRYRLTQQLADVFCAIGLPQEYEDSRHVAAGRILDGVSVTKGRGEVE